MMRRSYDRFTPDTYDPIPTVTLRTFILLICVSLTVALALVFLQLPGNTLFWQSVQNSGHTIIFFGLSFIVLFLMQRWQSNLNCTTIVSLSTGLFLLGLLIELAQHSTGRGASVSDLTLNAAGIVAGICTYAVINNLKHRTTRSLKHRLTIMLGIAVIAWSIQWPTTYLVAGLVRPSSPILANFDSFGAQHFVTGKGSTQTVAVHTLWPKNQTQSVRANFEPGRWPNIQFLEPRKNWSDFTQLTFNAYNPSARAVNIRVRIDDRSLGLLDDDHMTVSYKLKSGINQVSLGFDKFTADALQRNRAGTATFKEIASYMIFVSSIENNTVLYFDDFELR